jgi:bifunctional UDP-N-acetylglucosamine pyrophosphorylase/glucosamine-1-phosphate N-acetyltransferase
MTQIVGVVLAAGLGTRMKSETAKVLHAVCGRPMLAYVVDALRGAGATRIVAVVGHQSDRVRREFGDSLEYVLQAQQLGTGHAVMQAEPLLQGYSGTIVVANGDAPLLQASTLMRFLEHHAARQLAATVLTAVVADPTGYGRVVRDSAGNVTRIVEHKDATGEERAIREINTGMFAFAGPYLFPALSRLGTTNVQGEFYLTDTLAILRSDGHRIGALAVDDPREALGVNDRAQLAEAGGIMRERVLRALMLSGVTVVDPATTYIEPQVKIGRDTVVHPFTYLAGDTTVGEKCSLGPHCQVQRSYLGAGVRVEAAILEGCTVGAGALVGSLVYLKPGSVVPPHEIVQVGASKMGDE